MKLIDEMREKAESFRETSPYDYGYIADQIRDWADRIAASGALVPVPQGEECRVLRTKIGSAFQHLGKVYRNIGGEIRGDASEINARELMDGSKHIFDGDTIVLPVALVPITEAEV